MIVTIKNTTNKEYDNFKTEKVVYIQFTRPEYEELRKRVQLGQPSNKVTVIDEEKYVMRVLKTHLQ